MTSSTPADDLGPPPPPEVAARAAETSELSRSATSLIREAQGRSWGVSAAYARGSVAATVMVEDPGAPLTPTGRVARKATAAWQLVESVVVRAVSPLGDRAVFVYEGGAAVDAWIAPRGASGFTSAGHKRARAFVLGPWKIDEETDMGYVPAWRRELIKDAKRLAKAQICPECAGAVLVGFDQLDDVDQVAIVDAEPITGPYALLTEVTCRLAGRDAYSIFPARGGIELVRRDDYAINDLRWPIHLEHRCVSPSSNRSAAA